VSSDDLVAFHNAHADLSGASLGDFVVICIDQAADTWKLFEVFKISVAGQTVEVQDAEGRVFPVADLSQRDEILHVPQGEIEDWVGVFRACGLRDFPSLAAVIFALRPFRRRPATLH
jgi:hypothetical protein